MVLNFNIEIDEKQDIPIVRVTGDIDIYTCPKLNKGMSEAIEGGHSSIVLDLEGIHYLDSTGLGIIAHTARSLSNKKGYIYIVCQQPQIRKIFSVSGLDKKNIRLFDTESDVLSEIKG
ncbi:anti-sigma factor antagonist [bacterium]|jgi:anti-sigma B factor antagonist|nr:anti-sigma factor antagonist [bacterium]